MSSINHILFKMYQEDEPQELPPNEVPERDYDRNNEDDPEELKNLKETL